MTKRNVVWLITKLIGVYFAYWTIVAVFVLISSIYTYILLPSPPRFAKPETANVNTQNVSPIYPNNPSFPNPGITTPPAGNPASPATSAENLTVEKAKNEALKQLLWNLLVSVIYGLVAWYLIKDGRFLVAVLNREDPVDESGQPIESDSFPLSKKKEEMVTSLNLSDVRKEEVTSLNLSGSEKIEPPAAHAPAPDAAPTVAAPVSPTPPIPPIEPTVAPPANQTAAPLISEEAPLTLPADPSAPPTIEQHDFEDDGLIEQFNIDSPDERK